MIEIGLTKLDYSQLLENWELKAVYLKNTAMELKGVFEREAEKFFLEKEGDLKTVKIQFFELGRRCVSWVETICSFRFAFRSHGLSKCEGTLNLKVRAIIDRVINENVTLKEQ